MNGFEKRQRFESLKTKELDKEVIKMIDQMQYIHHASYECIKDVFLYIWGTCILYENLMTRGEVEKLYKNIALMLDNEIGPIDEEEFNYANDVISVIVKSAADIFTSIHVDAKTGEELYDAYEKYDLAASLKYYAGSERYRDVFSYKKVERAWFREYLKNNNVSFDEFKKKYDEEEEKRRKREELENRDKRFKYRNIQMIDAETNEIVKVFSSRQECMDEIGIKKSYLSQCIASCKVQHNGHNKYDGWKTYKYNDKKYYLKENID